MARVPDRWRLRVSGVPSLRFIAFSLLSIALLRKSKSSVTSDASLSLQARRWLPLLVYLRPPFPWAAVTSFRPQQRPAKEPASRSRRTAQDRYRISQPVFTAIARVVLCDDLSSASPLNA